MYILEPILHPVVFRAGLWDPAGKLLGMDWSLQDWPAEVRLGLEYSFWNQNREMLFKAIQDYPGSSVVRISPFNTGLQVWSLVEELLYHMPCGKKKKRSNTVTNSIQTLENDPHQKNKQINRSKARGMDDVTWGKNVEIERNLIKDSSSVCS